MKLISIVVQNNYVGFFIIITVLLHCVVVKETRNWHIMPLNNATLLFLNAMIKMIVYIFEYFVVKEILKIYLIIFKIIIMKRKGYNILLHKK